MVTVEPGQTTHPMCDPSDVDGMDDDEVQQHALALLARELGAEKVPTQTPEWVSTFAKKQLAAQRKGTSAAKTLGLPGRLAAVGVGSVSAKVTWDIPSHRDRLTADQQEQIRDIARRYATRHRDAHRSAASAPPAVSASYVLVVLSRADLDAFLVELTLVVKGAP